MDVTGADRLEDVGLEVASQEKVEEVRSTALEGISHQEMARVCVVHNQILTNLSHADWLEKRSTDFTDVIDVLTPCLMSYQIGSAVVRSAFDVLGKFVMASKIYVLIRM